jgi:hypothetical protein
MAFKRINIMTELERLARGEKIRISEQSLALAILGQMQAMQGQKPTRVHNDELLFLHRLYSLPDPRRPELG